MSVTLEQIDLLRKRANVSYQEAKEALETCNNQIVDALVYLEQNKKTKENVKCKGSKFMTKMKSLLQKGMETKFVIKNEQSTVLNIPVLIAIIITISTLPLAILGILIAFLTKHKIRFESSDNENKEVNEVFEKMSTAVTSVVDNISCEK